MLKARGCERSNYKTIAIVKPVIRYNNGGTAEIIEDQVTELLYNGGYTDLAHCMARFIANPEWTKKLGINEWEKARKEFTVEVYVKQVYKVLREVAEKK